MRDASAVHVQRGVGVQRGSEMHSVNRNERTGTRRAGVGSNQWGDETRAVSAQVRLDFPEFRWVKSLMRAAEMIPEWKRRNRCGKPGGGRERRCAQDPPRAVTATRFWPGMARQFPVMVTSGWMLLDISVPLNVSAA